MVLLVILFTTSLMCPSYSVFKIFLQIILLFNFPSIIHNLTTVKLLIISFFLQGTHSDNKVEQNEKRPLKVTFFFSHRKSNFCEVLTAFFGMETFTAKKQQSDKEGSF